MSTTVDSSDFPGGSTTRDDFNDSFNKTAETANTIATGAIVAIVVCSVLAVVSLGVFVWWFRRWTKRRRDRDAALNAAPLYYGPSPAAAATPSRPPQGDPATTYPPQSPAPEMAGQTSRWEAPGHHHHQQQQQQQQQQPYYPSGVSSTSGATAVESDGHPRYEMDGAAGGGAEPGKGDRYV